MKVLIRILLVWLVSSASAAQATTVTQVGNTATGILDLDIGGTLYNVMFDFVTDHSTGNPSWPDAGDIYLSPLSDPAGAQAATIAIVTALNDTSLGSASLVGPQSSNTFLVPYEQDPGSGGCTGGDVTNDLCAWRGASPSEFLPNSWSPSEAGIDSETSATIARFTEVSNVPVPPAIYLFGSGILGLIGLARRRRSESSQI